MEKKAKRKKEPIGRAYKDAQLLQILKMTPKEVKANAELNREEALALVGMYDSIQRLRIGAGNKVDAHERRVDIVSDPAVVTRLKGHLSVLEHEAARVMGAFAKSHPLGRWAMRNHGVGPVIAAGFLAHIDVTKAPSAGAVWKFAGMIDPALLKWGKGERRPYNARLKTLCFLLGESFKKFSNHPDCHYGHIYKKRKEEETARNDAGEYREKALARLNEAVKGRYGISPLQKETWASGKLQPVGLDRRAMRYAVRFFLSHYHYVACMITYGRAPDPWVIRYGGHVHWVPPFNFTTVEDL